MRRLLILTSLFLCLGFFLVYPRNIFAQQGPTINSISDNRSSYQGSQIPKYGKLEITFQVANTVAQNLQLPYEPPVPSGLKEADLGISVDAELLPPGETDWNNAYTQPAFYYQDFSMLSKNNGTRDWIYPNGNFSWKVRYAPNQVGNWQYRIKVRDASGSSTSNISGFSVVASGSKGFIRVAQSDKRYFEFDNGSYFAGLGYNMNYNHVNWVNPISQNQSNFQSMGQNGVQLIRVWLSQWSIFGAGWNPWKAFGNTGGDPPMELLTSNVNQYLESDHELALKVGTVYPCVFHDPYQNAPIAVKPNTTYQIRIFYYPDNIVGEGGFVAKLGTWQGCNSATAITPYVRQGANASWQWLTGTFTTGNQDFIDHLFLQLENITSGSVRVSEVEIKELQNNIAVGANILQKPKMDHHRYFDQRNSFSFDQVVELAKQNSVYLRPVIGDHREWTFTHIDHSGNPTGDFNPVSYYFYGPSDTSITKTRWLQKAWWRYLEARWGYSTNIHSWEYVNEGDPGYSGHRISVNMMGEYMGQFSPHQMVSTSVWTGTTSSWNLNNYPGIDFADVHCYIRRSGNPCVPLTDFYDEAQATIDASSQWGTQSNTRWPTVRGETGFVVDNNLVQDSDIRKDTNGVWLHNFLWAGLNSGGLIESYWFENFHIYDCPGGVVPCPLTFDHRDRFKPLSDFLVNIPLNQGGYTDIGALGYDNNSIRVIGQKNIQKKLAHLWIQNKKHTWCAVVGGISGCSQTWDLGRLTGSVTISGFSVNETLPVEYWQFDNGANLAKTSSQIPTNNQGELIINLNNLASVTTDVGVKIGNYNQSISITPTISPTPILGDANNDGRVDGADYVIWLNHYNLNVTGPANGDFNNSGNVDGADYVIWLNNYGV